MPRVSRMLRPIFPVDNLRGKASAKIAIRHDAAGIDAKNAARSGSHQSNWLKIQNMASVNDK